MSLRHYSRLPFLSRIISSQLDSPDSQTHIYPASFTPSFPAFPCFEFSQARGQFQIHIDKTPGVFLLDSRKPFSKAKVLNFNWFYNFDLIRANFFPISDIFSPRDSVQIQMNYAISSENADFLGKFSLKGRQFKKMQTHGGRERGDGFSNLRWCRLVWIFITFRSVIVLLYDAWSRRGAYIHIPESICRWYHKNIWLKKVFFDLIDSGNHFFKCKINEISQGE